MDLDLIYLGDCVDVMATLPDKSVNLIFADPPYNLQVKGELVRPDGSVYRRAEVDWDDLESSEYDRFTNEWLFQAKRVLDDTGAIWVSGTYHNIFKVGTALMNLGWFILNDLLWIKPSATPNFAGVRFCSAHETLIWAVKRKGVGYTFNYQDMKALNDGKQMRSDWYIKACRGKERIKIGGKTAHPAQKPEALLERIILATTLPHDIILDPFFGTGTTGAVADRLNRHWIGIDNNELYVDLAVNRISNQRKGG